MRRLLPLLLLVLLSSSPAVAGTSLESRIQTATGIVRAVDTGLQARAQQRAVEIQTNFGHCCLNGNEAEVIAWNAGFADPLAQLVSAWLASPEHSAILRDPAYRSIGCATALAGTRTYGVCILAAVVAPPAVIPNTAMEQP
jgi:hypothetical protein